MRWRSRSLLSSLRRFRSRAESAGFFRRPGPRRSDGTPARAVTSSLVHDESEAVTSRVASTESRCRLQGLKWTEGE